MKTFLKKLFYPDAPAQGAFVGTTLLFTSLWLGPALFLLFGGLANCSSPIRWPCFWQLIFILPIPFCALYALASWFHFTAGKFQGRKNWR